MFVAPPEKEVEWSDAGLEGSFRFLARVWRLVDHWAETIGGEGIPGLRRRLHSTTPSGRCGGRRTRRSGASPLDIEERMHLNTAVSALMELVNELYALQRRSQCVPLGAVGGRRDGGRRAGRRRAPIAVLKEAIEALVLMLSPFAPHMAEELWEMLGHPAA